MSDLTESHVALARITDALFCSDLETGDTPTNRQLAASVRAAFQKRRGWNGCTRSVAAAFATSPLDAEKREAWCHHLAEKALSGEARLDDLTQME